jgi:serine/threonine protein phosphatase 1
MWIREAFLDSRRDFGAVVVHGHSIRRKPEFRANRIGIDTGAVFTDVLTCLVLTGEARDVLQTG